MSESDAVDIAIQGNLEITRTDLFAARTFIVDNQKRVAKLIETRGVFSGLVRVAGKGKPGKAVVRKVETATVNILGIVGVLVLVGLALMPIPMILQYRKGIVNDVESSYKRAVMKNDGVEGFVEVPSTAPYICGNGDFIEHTFTM